MSADAILWKESVRIVALWFFKNFRVTVELICHDHRCSSSWNEIFIWRKKKLELSSIQFSKSHLFERLLLGVELWVEHWDKALVLLWCNTPRTSSRRVPSLSVVFLCHRPWSCRSPGRLVPESQGCRQSKTNTTRQRPTLCRVLQTSGMLRVTIKYLES